MSYVTDTELIKSMINSETPVSNERIIEDLINEDIHSEEKKAMYDGVRYYRSKNTRIMSRKFSLYSRSKDYQDFDIESTEDVYRANNKLANGFLKTLIDQKTNYCLSKPFILENADNFSKLIDLGRRGELKKCPKNQVKNLLNGRILILMVMVSLRLSMYQGRK